MRGALAADNTRSAVFFCPDGATNGTSATLFLGGILTMDPTGLTTSDEGKLLFLSAATAGRASRTPPSADNNIIQVVARVMEVATVARIHINIMPQYVRLVPAG